MSLDWLSDRVCLLWGIVNYYPLNCISLMWSLSVQVSRQAIERKNSASHFDLHLAVPSLKWSPNVYGIYPIQ